jgi:hypothetical protein
MQYHEIEAPLIPVMPRPIEERMAPGLTQALVRWVLGGAMRHDEDARRSRHTGARV